MFGYQIDCEQERYWGARAIYERQVIDLLPDRQNYLESKTGKEEFFLWLNNRALPWLRNEVVRLNLAANDPTEIVLSEFKFELRASTNSSYGYLYIGAVEHKLTEAPPRHNAAVDQMERVCLIGTQKFVMDDALVPVGTTGIIKTNSIGPAKVVGYYNENYAEDYKLVSLLVEASDPPEWWLKQTCRRDAEKAVKKGELPRLRGSLVEDNTPSPAALKEWKKTWKPGPFPIFASSFSATPA